MLIHKKYTAGMYECTCPPLNRSEKPFRDDITEWCIQQAARLHPDTHEPIVLTSLLPGGLLFDYLLITKLHVLGYTHIIYNAIEPLASKPPIKRALRSFKALVKMNKIPVHMHRFRSFKAYQAACRTQPKLRAHVLMCIDPNDKHYIPSLGSARPKREFCARYASILRPQAALVFLFDTDTDHYAHLLRGTYAKKKELYCLDYSWGRDSFEHHHRRIFLEGQEILPCGKQKNMVLINNASVHNPELAALFTS